MPGCCDNNFNIFIDYTCSVRYGGVTDLNSGPGIGVAVHSFGSRTDSYEQRSFVHDALFV